MDENSTDPDQKPADLDLQKKAEKVMRALSALKPNTVAVTA